MTRDDVIALAVTMGTPLEIAAANYDAAFPTVAAPSADDVVSRGTEARADGRWEWVVYGDGRREETLLP